MKNIFNELQQLTAEQREKIKEKLRQKGVQGQDVGRISVAPAQPYYPLSSAQKRMYTMFSIEPQTTVYNMPVVLMLKGILDVARLENAFLSLVERHESLRTSFHVIDGQVVQKINDVSSFRMEYEVREGWQSGGKEIEAMIKDFIRPFDLSRAPLVRIKLVKIASQEGTIHLLLQDKHHIVSDGTSELLLNKELIALYAGEELQPLSIQYKDYAVWQQEQLHTSWFEQQRKYWMNRFGGHLQVLDLPTDFPRPGVKSFRGDYYAFSLDKELTTSLNKLAIAGNVTLYSVLFSLFKVLLYRYSGEKELIIASDTANRTRPELQEITGMFINKLVIKSFPADDLPFDVFLKQVHETFAAALENQDYQFDMLVQDLNISRETSRNPIFDISMGFQNMDKLESVVLPEIEILPYHQEGLASSRLDLHMDGFERDGQLHFTFEYSTDLFRLETILRMAGHYQQIAREVVAAPGTLLGKINVLQPQETNFLLHELNNRTLPYEKDKTIQEVFERQVSLYPDHIAVSSDEEVLTYTQLNSKANQLAHLLRSKGVQRNQPVALLMSRSVEMVIGSLAILKAGACYVPVDSRYPPERIHYILKDCGAGIVLATMNDAFLRIFDNADFFGIDWVMTDDPDIFSGDTGNPENVNIPDDLAYIIYTSATTGQSKGVMVVHQGLQNLVANNKYSFNISAEDRVLQFATLSFDASVFEVFTALLTGAALYIVPEGVIQDYGRFEQYLNEKGITMTLLPPVYAQHLEPANLHSLRVLFTGGSASNLELEKKWKSRVQYVNAYGPTEATVVASYFISDPMVSLETTYGVVPIGQPLYNTQLYVLNDLLQPVPVGVTGELCIAGDSVAKGYWGQEELTVAAFVDNPFGEGKIYRSGDLVAWLPDGNLAFRGRKDDQVKIRGFRIEPLGVEKVLLKHPAVKEGAVLAIADESNPGEKFLCAYYTLEDNNAPKPSTADIARFMEQSLPAYMIPQYFIWLEEMPLNLNGKVDRKLLPLPEEQPSNAGGDEQEMSPLEQSLAAIWRSVLKKDNIGLNDNFFSLGGDSIKAITLVSMINKEMNLGLVINNIFANQTVGLLASFISRQSGEAVDIPSLTVARDAIAGWKERQLQTETGWKLDENVEDLYPMSDIQAGMFFHYMVDRRLYNNQIVFEIVDADFQWSRIEDTFRQLAQRHNILRTGFYLNGFEGPATLLYKEVDIDSKLHFEDLSHLNKEQQENYLQEYMEEDRRIGFELTTPGLWRAAVFQISSAVYAIMLACHHAIMDGWSDAVFLTEFSQLCQGLKEGVPVALTPLKCTYKDYVADQWRYKHAPSVKQYWAGLLEGYERLPLPLSKKVKDTGAISKSSHYFYVDKDLQAAMLRFAQENDMNLKHICLAAYLCMLQLTTGKQDLTIGLLTHGRPELEDAVKILGCFLNTVPFRTSFDRIYYAREVLDMVKTSLDAQQGVDRLPLTDIVAATGERSSALNSLFDVFFGYLNFHVYEQAAEGIQAGSLSKGFGLNNTWFDCLVQYYDEICISFHYLDGLYSSDELKRLETYYVNLLKRLVGYPQEVIRNIDIIAPVETEQVQRLFNLTGSDEGRQETVVSLFRQQAKLSGDAIAVISGTQQLSYAELHKRSDQLAALLVEKGVGRDVPVVLLAAYTAEMVIGVLAILKAGGCYVPVDPAYPADRQQVMIRECGASIIVAEDIRQAGNFVGLDVIAVNQDLTSAHALPAVDVKATDLAYIMYTSGTTGVPKGVMVEHRSIVRLVNEPNYVQLGKDTRILMTGAVSFDATTFEMWGALLNGGTLHLLSHDELMDAGILKQYIHANSINTMWFTASWFNQLVDLDVTIFNGLQYILVGGEKLSPAHVNRLYRSTVPGSLQIINGYGPTENTTFSLCLPVRHEYETDIPLGYPINETQVYILDPYRQPVPVGVPGEIYLAGEGLARGYFRQPVLTAEKFVTLYLPHPERAYASGDIGYWQADGTVVFAGRKDEQVKIRGHRIEPAEIEQVLLQHPQVANAVVNVFVTDLKEKVLVAYVIAKAGDGLEATILKKYLSGLLPHFMVPEHFFFMEKFPLTSNGKIDRKLLPDPVIHTAGNYVPPRNETETLLAGIWEEVLGIRPIGIADNFFELGGHSLKASLTISRMTMQGVEAVSIRDIFKNPTIELLAEELGKRKRVSAELKVIDL
ncbi:non-ribosomal peptide synthetase [Chitinophaga filiformis]|uniref:Surfactin family lipopeptide synthetase A n=1 Tax=Chitinophaga filiformis TaxID=104663 RepID=A0A1G8B7S4_CHIFI|nr:non-ribosomal peptide synthetase [Chitinophaga filiformis]SDH29174.1 surfactin family lipopeptide synthetase A [Chitinophaga filiformis]